MTGGRTVKRLVFEATALALVAFVALAAAGCATGRAQSRAQKAGQAGNWDEAVTYYREAVRRDPNNARYRIQLERAMESASRQHETIANDLVQKGDSRTRCANTASRPTTLLQSGSGGQGERCRADPAREARGEPAEAED
jgi:hypothetical protein